MMIQERTKNFETQTEIEQKPKPELREEEGERTPEDQTKPKNKRR